MTAIVSLLDDSSRQKYRPKLREVTIKLRPADVRLIEKYSLTSEVIRRDEAGKPVPAVDRYCAEIVEVYCAYLRGTASDASNTPFTQPIKGGKVND